MGILEDRERIPQERYDQDPRLAEYFQKAINKGYSIGEARRYAEIRLQKDWEGQQSANGQKRHRGKAVLERIVKLLDIGKENI